MGNPAMASNPRPAYPPRMSKPIPFKPDRFASAAPHYRAGRPAYAPRLISRVAALANLNPTTRMLDLGCGTGELAHAFAPLVAHVLAADPSPEMLAIAAENQPANLTLRQASSYDLDASFAPADFVAIGRAFHWMDRADTLHRLDAIIPQGGTIALFEDTHPDLPDNAWEADYQALLRRFSRDNADRRRWKGGSWVRHEAFLLDSPFSQLEQIAVIERRRTPAVTLADRILSLSSTSPARLGEKANALLGELETLLARIAPDGWLTEVVATSALIARRP